MKMFYRSVIIFGMLGQILYADALSDKKAELERQIAELEAKQNKQKEVEELERRLQQLQTKADQELSGQTPRQQTAPQQTTVQNPNSSGVITQEMRDAEVKNIFGKNRNGVLIGLGFGVQMTDFTGKSYALENEPLLVGAFRFGYQRFPGNKAFGFRLYVDSFAGNNLGDGIVIEKVSQQLVAFNADILMDLNIPNTYNYFGLFAGVGYGQTQFNFEKTLIFGTSERAELKLTSAFINAGIASTLSAKHRLEAYFKFTTGKYNDKFYWKTSPIIALMYQYTF
uniref:Outer membrane beta-barrel protein n=1 Tax=uncultured Helicobacter sp. TaxID=175537 RepID=A0A650ELI2_9HELI|nr:hypothetical protein Helico4rc_2610 [uncultured Helicobacter sp.]